MKNFPRPTGQLQGDDAPMPDRGTKTGFSGHPDQLDGTSTDGDATNRTGSVKAGSDPADRSMPIPPAR